MPAKIWLSLSMFRSHYVCCLRFDITVWQCDIELATLEFHNATLKFDNTTLIFHATFKLRVFNFTPTIRHAQLSFYARFNMLGCHFMLVSLFNSRQAWMINRGNTLYFCGLNPIWRAGVSRKTLTSDLRPWEPQIPRFFLKTIYQTCLDSYHLMFYSHTIFIDNSPPERNEIFVFSGLSLSPRSNSEKLTSFR